MRVGDVAKTDITGFSCQAIDYRLTVGGGQVGTATLTAERFLNGLYKCFEIFRSGINFINHDNRCHAAVAGNLKQLAGVHLDARRSADNNHRSFGSSQRTDSCSLKVRVARCIDKIYYFGLIVNITDC